MDGIDKPALRARGVITGRAATDPAAAVLRGIGTKLDKVMGMTDT
jgi:hypothetical protein